MDRGRHCGCAADRFPRRAHSRARTLSPAGARARARALCRRAGRGGVRHDPYIAEDAADLVAMEIEELPVILAADAAPGEFASGRNTEAEHHPPGLRRRRRGVSHRRPSSSSSTSRSAAIPACRSKTRGAIGRYDAARDMLELHGAAKVPHRNRELLARMLKPPPTSLHLHEVPCRRRLRHARRTLSRGRAGLRRRACGLAGR